MKNLRPSRDSFLIRVFESKKGGKKPPEPPAPCELLSLLRWTGTLSIVYGRIRFQKKGHMRTRRKTDSHLQESAHQKPTSMAPWCQAHSLQNHEQRFFSQGAGVALLSLLSWAHQKVVYIQRHEDEIKRRKDRCTHGVIRSRTTSWTTLRLENN